MALKGSAVIELTDKNGNKKVIRHCNLVTNAASALCKSSRGEIATIAKYMKKGDSYMQALFGGILLFSDALDSDADNYDIPSGHVVGYASQDAYAGLDTARGSFNALESGVQEDGKSYKFVWDFSTAQANGTIKAIGLCPNMMGQIGMSANAVKGEAKNFKIINNATDPFTEYMLESGATTAGIDNYNFYIAAIVGDVAYAINSDNIIKSSDGDDSITQNGGILRLYKFKLGTNSIGVAETAGMAAYVGCVDVQLPPEFRATLTTNNGVWTVRWNYVPSTGKLIVFPAVKSIPAKGTCNYLEIDLKNGMSIKSYTFTNTTSGSISNNFKYGSYGSEYNFFVGKSYILAIALKSDGNRYLYSINRENNTDVKELKLADGTEYSIGTKSTKHFQPVFCADNTMAIYITNSEISDFFTMFVDHKNGIIHKTNARTFSYFDNIDIGNPVVRVATGKYLGYTTVMNPFVLCTKNNLGTEITKTSAQTMKITYTLTESEG